jgi:pimeloyl-ACP methyl ester carboxylesterase
MNQEHQNHPLRLADGRTLGYAAYGSPRGPAVLHFHAAGSSRLEHPVAHTAVTLPAVRLLVVDRPGHGLSSFQPRRTLLDWAVDVKQLADHLGLEQFSVTGWSAGGPYALACAFALPERVKAAALLCG